MNEQQPEQKKEQITSREARDGDFGIAPMRMVGNLGRDPESNYTPAGQAVTRFSLGVWNGRGGDTRWFKCTAWGELAEEARDKLRKGMRVEVAGRLKFTMWQGKDQYEVNVNWIQILIKPPAITSEPSEKDKLWEMIHEQTENTPF